MSRPVQAPADRSGTVVAELPGTGVSVTIWPGRVVSIPALGVLLVADTHFGKSQTLRTKGVPIPPGVTSEAIGRLTRTIGRSGAQRVIVLGDLLHAPAGMTDDLVAVIRSFVDSAGVPIDLVPGNHDEKLRGDRLGLICDRLGIGLLGPRMMLQTNGERALELVHDADEEGETGAYRIGGHLHPAVVLRGGGDAVKLPALVLGSDRMVLPAFSSFVAGGRIDPVAGDRVFAVAEHTVFDVPNRAQQHDTPIF